MYKRLEATDSDEERGEDTKNMKYGNELAWYHKAFWIMYSITANVTLAIAVFYYGYFYFREIQTKVVLASYAISLSTRLLHSSFLWRLR